jgi:CRP/FNR family nitrogen fixation transcriptional regulator
MTKMIDTASFIAPAASATRGGSGSGLAELFALSGAAMPFARNAEIYGEDEPADYAYRVVRGAVRICKLLSDGRRQIEAFHLPGDIFGIELGGSHRFTAEAVSDCVVLLVRRGALTGFATRDAEAARELWALATRALERAQEHVLLLGRKTAQERVASFLLDLPGACGGRAGTVEIPMSRQDIADYLGLTIETVSRTMTAFETGGLIGLHGARQVELRDRPALRALGA